MWNDWPLAEMLEYSQKFNKEQRQEANEIENIVDEKSTPESIVIGLLLAIRAKM